MPTPLPLPSAPTSGTVAKPPSAPTVISYDEQEYVCKPGDTFASISKQYYLGDAYAEALKRHNLQHPRAVLQVENGRTLTPGDRIYIPQTAYLEQRYADAISRPASSPSSAVTPATFSPSGSMPVPSPVPSPIPPAK